MVLRIGGFFVQNLHRLSIQLRKLALESNPVYPADIVAVVIFEEEVQVVHISERGSLDRQLLDVISSRDMERLSWGEIGGSREVEVIAVVVQLQCLR